MTESSALAGVPIWRHALAAGEPTSFDPERIEVDVAIIGGGLTGLSAAYHILAAQPDLRVVVLEAKQIGYGASSRNTGMVTPGVGQNLAGLVRRFGAEAAREIYRSSLRAVDYVRELTEREGIEAGLQMNGQLIVAQGRSGRRRLTRQAELLESLRLPCRRLETVELQERLRIALDAPGGAGTGPAALWLPVAGTLHPGRLLEGLRSTVLRRGGRILEGAPVLSVSRGVPVRLGLTGGREVHAQHAIVASSGYASPLNLQRGRLLPLHLRVLLTEPLSTSQLTEIGWANREGVIDSRRLFNYFRLTEDNRILFGGGRPAYLWGGQTTDRPAAGPALDDLVQELRNRFPMLDELAIARSWTGAIGYTLDNLPVIGRAPGHERVIHVGGWCGHGIALGIYSGRWVQELMASGTAGEPLPWFRRRSPLAPLEPARWLAARMGGWAMSLMDRF